MTKPVMLAVSGRATLPRRGGRSYPEPRIETRSIEQIECDYGVELTNDIMAQYWSDQRGNGLGVLSVVSRWNAGCQVDNDDIEVHEAVLDMDKYIAWARDHLKRERDPDVNLDEALACRALFAAHWNTQFNDGGHRDDDLGPIEEAGY